MVDDLLRRLGVRAENIFVGGRWVETLKGEKESLTSPLDDRPLIDVSSGSEEDAAEAVSSAFSSQQAWQKRSAIQRAEILLRLADLLVEHKKDLAKLATLEHGKPAGAALEEVDDAVLNLRYVAWSARHLSGEIRHAENAEEQLWTQLVPYGVVVGLIPWNYPLAVAVRKAAPALLTGNTIVLKPHELAPLTVLALAELARRAGVPDGVLNVVTGHGRTVGSKLVTDKRTALISLTGSSRAGREIYALGAPDLKPVRLELGGKAPFIVMQDADLDKAVRAAVVSKFTVGGQICTAADRIYVHEKIYDEFAARFVSQVEQLKVGDPTAGVDIGPWISRAEIARLDRIAQEAFEDGASQLNKEVPLTNVHQQGRWTFPRVFEVSDNRARVMKEETFGPITALLKIGSFEEAISYANDTDYGLSAFLWTNSNRLIMRAVQDLEFGELYINRQNGESVHGFHTGYKSSGLGGEDGIHGLLGYLRLKSVYNNYN